jgi:excisionase family DNA binding protein
MFNSYNDVVTVCELAKMLKIGRNTAYELVRAGVIPSFRIGRQIRVSKQAVVEFLSRTSSAKEA